MIWRFWGSQKKSELLLFRKLRCLKGDLRDGIVTSNNKHRIIMWRVRWILQDGREDCWRWRINRISGSHPNRCWMMSRSRDGKEDKEPWASINKGRNDPSKGPWMTVTWKGIKGHGWGTSKLEGFLLLFLLFLFLLLTNSGFFCCF